VSENSTHPPKRILVIDDQRDVRMVLQAMLTRLGNMVLVAQDGPEGLAKAMSDRPEVVICDIVMPGDLDGYAVARCLRQDPETASCFLIALTGRNDAEDIRLARQAGFDAHAVKPVDFAKLRELLSIAAAQAKP
jgi:CheY-like chemotaxis protein